MDSKLRPIENNHRNYILNMSLRYFYDPPVGLITIIHHPNDVPDDETFRSLTFNPPAPNAYLTLKEVVRVLFVDSHDR